MGTFLKISITSAILSIITFVIFCSITAEIITKKYEYIGAGDDYHYYWDNKEVKRVYNNTNILVEDGVIKITKREIVDNWKRIAFDYSSYFFLGSVVLLIIAIIYSVIKSD